MKEYFHKHLDSVLRIQNKSRQHSRSIDISRNEKLTDYPSNFFKNFLFSITQDDFKYYPTVDTLYYKISKYLNVDRSNILITPGSDTAIKTIFEAIDLNGNEVLTTEYHFPMYDVYSSLENAKLIRASYKSNRFTVSDLLSRITHKTKLIVIANPNSPLGDYHSIEEFKPILETGIPVLVDEAYIELTNSKSFVEEINNYPNLIITRTFSKGFGAAGCRVGYIVSNTDNMKLLSKYRFMYEISSISVRYTEALLDQYELVQDHIESVLSGKKELVSLLRSKDIEVVDTDSSWFFIKKEDNENLLGRDGLKFRCLKLPEDKSIWVKFNYDPIIKSTNFYKMLCEL